MITCSNCGNQISEGVNFCEKCGTPVTAPVQALEPEQSVTPPVPVETSPQPVYQQSQQSLYQTPQQDYQQPQQGYQQPQQPVYQQPQQGSQQPQPQQPVYQQPQQGYQQPQQPVYQQPQQGYQQPQQGYQQPPQGYGYQQPYPNQNPNQDIADNKVMAVLAYFGLLVLIPIFAAKESKFAKFHSNQGLILLIISVGLGIINAIISAVTVSLLWRAPIVSVIINLIFSAAWIFVAVLSIMGIVNAATGKEKELPLIGKIKILK